MIVEGVVVVADGFGGDGADEAFLDGCAEEGRKQT